MKNRIFAKFPAFPLAVLACGYFLCCIGATDIPNPSPAPTPLLHAHAHNDYEHKRPLFDAVDNGFTSVEADVYLVNGKLLVAHMPWEVKTDRTLESLYLDPLKKRIDGNGGRVYPGGPPVVLLIDVKTDPVQTYAALKKVFKQYAPILTIWHDDKPERRALQVIITGNRSQKLIAADKERYAACDGELKDLDTNPPAELVPWISAQWSKSFKWNGNDKMPVDQKAVLDKIVKRCHEQHRKLRFWGSPDFPAFWAVLRDHGVDLVNTDHLPECRAFLIKRGEENKS
ncbi:MAG TPA: phosphatidylinositol-specific phospholipase C/glycerophosphodiester phosphodiesterase family protein [Tepidisphaeraceae bacterium]|nr:phosphatidylinositol-specific phospholipase C/glycerophosphodiester phosphodiesterase family protein [Tepidisphaeraceae bacterium]